MGLHFQMTSGGSGMEAFFLTSQQHSITAITVFFSTSSGVKGRWHCVKLYSSFLQSWFQSVLKGRERPLLYGMSQGMFYIKPLDEVSSLCRQHHHPHSAQGTTGYNSTLARLNGSGFQDPLAPGNFSVWSHMIASVHNFWVILDLCLLLEEVSAAARRVFAQLHFGHQFQGSAHGHSPPGHLLSGLQIQGLHGSVLEQHLEASAVQTVMGAFIFSACNPSACSTLQAVLVANMLQGSIKVAGDDL